MSSPEVTKLCAAHAAHADLIAELRDLNDYHDACEDVTVEGHIAASIPRTIRFDGKTINWAGIVKRAVEARMDLIVSRLREMYPTLSPPASLTPQPKSPG